MGKLNARGKKIWFDFDVNAFADEDFVSSAATSSAYHSLEQPVYETLEETQESMQETIQAPSPRSVDNESPQYEEEQQQQYQYEDIIKSSSAEMENQTVNHEQSGGDDSNQEAMLDEDFKSALLGSGSNPSGDTCLEDAYSRFITDLEKVCPCMSLCVFHR